MGYGISTYKNGDMKVFNIDLPEGDKHGIFLKADDVPEFVEGFIEQMSLEQLERMEDFVSERIYAKQDEMDAEELADDESEEDAE